MSDDYATLNGARVTSGVVCMPYYGIWCADIVLADTTTLPLPVTLTVGNMTLVGHTFRTASFAGSRSARIVGGAGGWRNDVPAQGYYNKQGVKRSLLLRDAAAVVGEQVNIPMDAVVSQVFVREQGPASRLVKQVLGDVWWVDSKGVMQAGDRVDFRPITSDFTVVGWSGGQGKFDVATEDVAAFLPGRTFSAPTVTIAQKISSSTFTFDNEGDMRIDILTSGNEDV